ncbi:ADP-ribosylglycohydrolase family protein [Oceanidesulfovibrio marinus]|uniref:ADP-ribosylglycohydrolase family protein n=1 Tax=Oceanidesulfovibrio marinus TaxID=370038 RepID=A0A6P1ZLX2_9BACT|nr:ADP-ribosylglycohydrolase family protein [Oceanidesulfovibrio marinus]TVM36806.1 ADP-ribosylglycohydrolase family protein [Oceanidesulfovibrio marinus]
MSVSRKERIAGTIMGSLIGDALGVGPHWYYDLDTLRQDYGDWIDGYTEPKQGRYHAGLKAGESSQTGQVTAMLLESVAEKGGYDEDDFTGRVDSLLETLDGTAKGGRYTDQAMREVWHARIKVNKPWRQSGSLASTAEAAIRVPVLAGRYAGDMGACYDAITANVILTHRAAETAGRSVAFGLLVHALVNGASMPNAKQHVMNGLRDAGKSLAMPVPAEAVEYGFIDDVLNVTWISECAKDPAIAIEPAWKAARLYGLACPLASLMPAAVYFAARFEGDFESAVLHAVNSGGNNMARAALTGAMSGALVGLGGIPERFIDGLHDSRQLLTLAEQVAEAAG